MGRESLSRIYQEGGGQVDRFLVSHPPIPGEKAKSKGRGAGRHSKPTSPPMADQLKIAPNNRASLSSVARSPLAGNVRVGERQRVQPSRGSVDGLAAAETPVKERGHQGEISTGSSPKVCVLQTMFGYGSPG